MEVNLYNFHFNNITNMVDKILKIKTPNGIKVNALAIKNINDYIICYSQNRIFTIHINDDNLEYDKILVDYCIIPDYDDLLLKWEEALSE